jgi:hypothetical protein
MGKSTICQAKFFHIYEQCYIQLLFHVRLGPEGVRNFIGPLKNTVEEGFQHILDIFYTHFHALGLQALFDLLQFPGEHRNKGDTDTDHEAYILGVHPEQFEGIKQGFYGIGQLGGAKYILKAMGNVTNHQQAYKKKQGCVFIRKKNIDSRSKNDKGQDTCGITEGGFYFYTGEDHDQDIDETICPQYIIVRGEKYNKGVTQKQQ